MRRLLALGTLTALSAMACTGGDDGPAAGSTTTTAGTGGATTSIQLADVGRALSFDAVLSRFDSCDALLGWVKSEAGARVGPYGFGTGGPYYWAEGDMVAATETTAAGAARDDDAGEAAAPSGEGGDGGDGFSTTNVQEAGVDEPDIVKTDGDRIVAIANGRIHLVDATGEPRVIDSDVLPTDTYPSALFLSGDRAFVFGQGSFPAASASRVAGESIYPDYSTSATTVTEFDLSGDGLRTVGTLRLEGYYLSAREVGGTARLVISTPPSDLPFVYPQSQAGEERARRANQEAVAESTIEDWLPKYELDLVDGGERTGVLTDCADAHAPSEFAGFSTISVITFDLNSSIGLAGATTVFADGQTVYASPDSLYVATQSYIDPLVLQEIQSDPDRWEQLEADYGTSIHKFAIAGSEPASYLASGSVKGHLLNQFSLSEFEGNLRIATTVGSPWSSASTSESKIVVLSQNDDRLQTIGEVGGMGRGEQIYSVRFVGPTAYVVTFRQTDPFYTVDLSAPSAPRVIGELKIPGYSGYLHPIGDDRILGVGQDATAEGRVTGTKVTLFDVADLANPRELATWSMPSAYSDAEYDHHAFLYWEPTGIVVLPINAYAERFAGAVVLRVSDTGLEEVGRVSQLEVTGVPSTDCAIADPERVAAAGYAGSILLVCDPGDTAALDGYSCYEESATLLEAVVDEVPAGSTVHFCYPYDDLYEQAIQRTLVIGDALWTLSYTAIQSNDLATLAPRVRLPLS